MAKGSNITTILSAAASIAAIGGFMLARKRQPMRLAPGVSYEATVSVSPKVNDDIVIRMVSSVLGEVIDANDRGNTTVIQYTFTAVAPREVVPGETLFQLEGRKAVLKSIKEV